MVWIWIFFSALKLLMTDLILNLDESFVVCTKIDLSCSTLSSLSLTLIHINFLNNVAITPRQFWQKMLSSFVFWAGLVCSWVLQIGLKIHLNWIKMHCVPIVSALQMVWLTLPKCKMVWEKDVRHWRAPLHRIWAGYVGGRQYCKQVKVHSAS